MKEFERILTSNILKIYYIDVSSNNFLEHCSRVPPLFAPKAIDKILLPWRPHHRKVARYVNIFLRVAIFCALNVATVAIICALNVATVATFN